MIIYLFGTNYLFGTELIQKQAFTRIISYIYSRPKKALFMQVRVFIHIFLNMSIHKMKIRVFLNIYRGAKTSRINAVCRLVMITPTASRFRNSRRSCITLSTYRGRQSLSTVENGKIYQHTRWHNKGTATPIPAIKGIKTDYISVYLFNIFYGLNNHHKPFTRAFIYINKIIKKIIRNRLHVRCDQSIIEGSKLITIKYWGKLSDSWSGVSPFFVFMKDNK